MKDTIRLGSIVATLIISGIGRCQDNCDKRLADIESHLHKTEDKQLASYAARVEEWHRSDGPLCYAKISLTIANAFADHSERDDRSRQLERHYAELGLSVADSVPVDLELYLVKHLVPSFETGAGASDETWRMAALWAHAWHRIEVETIPNFDFGDLPFINVPLPIGSAGAAGMAPDAIPDPRQRAEYAAAIQANKKKLETYNTQLMLRRATPDFTASLENFFVKSFRSTDVGSIVGVLSSVRSVEKERIINRIADNRP